MAFENHEETEEKTAREQMLIDRVKQTLSRIEQIEEEIPKLTKEYEGKMKKLLDCTDNKRSKILRGYIRERRLYIKQLENTRRKLIREIDFLTKMYNEEA